MRGVRCKFKVTGKQSYGSQEIDGKAVNMVRVDMFPVSGDPVYGKYTPGGAFNATMVESSANLLDIGKEYYIDITPVEE